MRLYIHYYIPLHVFVVEAPGKGGDTNTLQTGEKKASGFGIFGLMIWLAVRICAVDNNVLSCGD